MLQGQIEDNWDQQDDYDNDYSDGDDDPFATPNDGHLNGQVSSKDLSTGYDSQSSYFMRMTNEKDDMFSYFDQALLKNWAGPEHWKLKPIKGKLF